MSALWWTTFTACVCGGLVFAALVLPLIWPGRE